MICKPNEGAKPGTLHTLRDRVSGRQETFEWTGKSWSTPGTGWGTKWSLMDALGWRYIGPVTDGVSAPDGQTDRAAIAPAGDGPHEPALLTTDAAMLAQARELRAWLIERAEAEGDDSAAHIAHCYRLRAAVQDLVRGIQAEGEVDRAQHALLEETQQEVKRLQAELDETKRPLDAQMARLNQRVIELTAQRDTMVLAVRDLFGAELEKCMRYDGKDDQLAAVEALRAAYAAATGEQP